MDGIPGVPAVRWTPAQKTVARATKMVAKEALEAGVEAGVAVSEGDPDLSGDWRQEDDWGDGIVATLDIHRTREATGLYAFSIDVRVQLEGTAFMKVQYSGFEVIGANRQCQYTRESSISFASADLEALFPGADAFTPDRMNEDPCSDLVALTVDRIEGTLDVGSFREERVR